MKPDGDTLSTSWTQVARLKNLDDQESWKEFYDRYRPLIVGVARRAGLREEEAEEVLQETMKSVSQHIGAYEADPKRGPFRPWLLNMVQWRIRDQLSKRLPVSAPTASFPDATATTPTVERVADPRPVDLEGVCDAEWQQWFKAQTLKELQVAVKAEHYQVFHLLTIEEKTVAQVAAMVGCSTARVYLVKHRVGKALKKIVARLEKELG